MIEVLLDFSYNFKVFKIVPRMLPRGRRLYKKGEGREEAPEVGVRVGRTPRTPTEPLKVFGE